MGAHKCIGCLTLPTNGFDSKPPNADGLTRWCPASRTAAMEQEEDKLHTEFVSRCLEGEEDEDAESN